jgi:hypothetical protein
MVDKLNPTNQFHPYQPAGATPQAEKPMSGGFGAISDKLKGVDVRSQVNKARDLARSNPAIALGGLAAAAIGLGLMRKRSMS